MSLTLKTGQVKVNVDGTLQQLDVVSADTATEIATIKTATDSIVSKAQAAQTTAANAVSAAQTAADKIESQKDTMIASIASVAGQGTDTTLTQSGVAADAKVVGDEVSEIKEDLTDLKDITVSSVLATELVSNKISGAVIDGSGTISDDGGVGYSIYYAYIGIYDKVTVNTGKVYGFFANEPTIGSQTYDKSRVVESLSYTEIDIPDGVNYIAVRDAGSGSVETEFSVTNELVNKLDTTNENVSNNEKNISNIKTALTNITETNLAYLVKADTKTVGKVTFTPSNGIKNIDISGTTTVNPEFEFISDFSLIEKGKTYNIDYSYSGENVFIQVICDGSALLSKTYCKGEKVTIPSNAETISFKLLVLSSYTEGSANMGIYNNSIEEVTVGNSGADYTSLLEALKNTNDDVVIHILSGSYDVEAEYTDYYGTDFWTNYTDYAEHSDDLFYRGLWLAKGRKIYGDSNVIIKFEYDGTNSKVQQYFSVFANDVNTEINNITIKVSHYCRYSIHDDFQPTDGTVNFKNIIFDGNPGANAHIGAGLGINTTYYIEGCVFLNNSGVHDISYHGNSTSSTTAQCKIYVRNCYGTRTCKFRWYGASTKITDCIVSGSTFSSIVCEALSSEAQNENMVLYKYNCIEAS